MHKQPFQRMVSRKCTGWSGEKYLKNGTPDHYLVYHKQMFGQAICSPCRITSTPKSSETPDNQNLTSPMDEEGEKAAIEDEDDVNVMIQIRKSDRRRTKSFKLREQDEFTLEEAKTETEEESDQVEEMDLDESDDNSPPTQSQTERHGFCEDCGKTVARLSHHTRRVHLKEKNHVCNECGAAFFDKRALKTHEENVHKDRDFNDEDKESLIPCGECGARFNSKLNLKKHMTHAHMVKQVKIRVEEPLHPGTGPFAIIVKEGSHELVISSNSGAHIPDLSIHI